jgi:DNA-nicking Smr family endonuclease
MAKKQEPEDFSFRPFSNLKKTIDAVKVKTPVAEKSAKAVSDPDDEELFRREMKGVREIREFRKIHVARRQHIPMPQKLDSEKEALKILEDISQGRRPIKLADTQEYVEWVNKEYSSAPIAIILHEGHFAIQDFLDLHGFTVDEAKAHVDDFLRRSLLNGLRCIKIIHGRGLKSPQGPVLKESLVGWLAGRYRKNIIAFATARRCDGGLGALYLLLKERRLRKI